MRLERICPVENLAIFAVFRSNWCIWKKKKKKKGRNKSHHDSIYLDTRRIKVILLETKEKKGRIVEFRCDNVTFLQWGALHTRDNESILAIYEVNEFPVLRSKNWKLLIKQSLELISSHLWITVKKKKKKKKGRNRNVTRCNRIIEYSQNYFVVTRGKFDPVFHRAETLARMLRPTFHELFAPAERARRARSAASRDHQASGTNERRETPLSVAPPER